MEIALGVAIFIGIFHDLSLDFSWDETTGDLLSLDPFGKPI